MIRSPRTARLRTTLAAVLGVGLAASVLTTATATPAAAATPLTWNLVSPSGTNHYRGLSPVSDQVAWISGYNGQVLRTLDGGAHWKDASPKTPGAGTLQFRDIEATDAYHAVIMSSGDGAANQLLVTDDGGKNWTVANTNANPAAFYDCMSFSDGLDGLVMSDPVGGKFRILATHDGGHHWSILPNAGMPAAKVGEAGFAASGECLATSGDDAWFGSGGAKAARIFHSTDGGLTWVAKDSTIARGATSGVFGLAFSTPSRGVVVGGDFNAKTAHTNVAATQLVKGQWQPSTTMPSGYRSGVTFVPGTLGTVLAVGLTGSDVSRDGGRTWKIFDKGQFDTVACTTGGACWASGDLGRVAVLQGL